MLPQPETPEEDLTGITQPGVGELEWAQRQIAKYDTNYDGKLTSDEWQKMIIKPIGADTNGDGIITQVEYANFRARR